VGCCTRPSAYLSLGSAANVHFLFVCNSRYFVCFQGEEFDIYVKFAEDMLKPYSRERLNVLLLRDDVTKVLQVKTVAECRFWESMMERLRFLVLLEGKLKTFTSMVPCAIFLGNLGRF
jgi:hypothetical protein